MSISVKNQNEFLLYYTFRQIGMIGELKVDVNGSDAADYTSLVTQMSQENQDALSGGTYGNNLYIQVDARAIADTAMTVEVKGTDEDDASATKEVIIPARTQVTQCILVGEPGADKKWKTITSVLAKETQPSGQAVTVGAVLNLIMFPQAADFIAPKGKIINFDNGFSWSLGTTSKAVPNKFNPVDHYKRIRGENTISVTQLYTLDADSLQYLRDRDVVIKAEVHEDGSAEIAETHYFSFVRFTSVPLSAGGDGADVSQDAEGLFRQKFTV